MNTKEIPISDFVRNSYLVFGKSSNIDRHLPFVLDGWKPVNQRVIYSALEYTDFIKTATLIGNCIGKFHPHGLDSMKDVITRMVKIGLLDGQGNFGYRFLTGEACEAANPRYTEVRIKPEIREQIKTFLNLIPKVQSEVGYDMPEYVPTPVPYALIGGDEGIAIGINQRIPAFTAKSLIDAYRSDDPTKLESQYGLELIKSDCDLKGLWEQGSGKLHFKMRTIPDPNGITIEGDTSIFVPNLKDLFIKFKAGTVDYQDLSTEIGRLRFSKSNRIRSFNNSDVQRWVETASHFCRSYYIRIHDREVAQPISIRKWMEICYKNYFDLTIAGTKSEINKLNDKILFYKNLREVYKRYLSNESKELLSNSLNIPVSVINSIVSKSAEYVRGCDTNKEIKSCEDKINSYKKNTGDSLIDRYVEALK